jgi:hypothetical protein
MSIRDDYDALMPDRVTQTTQDPELRATGTDYTRTRVGSFGVSQQEAIDRDDVILDKEMGVLRELQPGEAVTKDTNRLFRLEDGSTIDLTLAEAFQFGVISEWNDEWGSLQQPEDLTPEEREALEQYGSKAKHGAEVLEGFSPDTPLEAANFAMEADIHGLPRAALGELAEHVGFTRDGEVKFTDTARKFLGDSLGIRNNPEQVASGIFQAWSKVAREAIGQDGIDQISTAAIYNPEARQDIIDVYRKGITGQLTKADFTSLSEKWSR